MQDLGVNLEIELEIDANATIGIVARQGLGRMKHVEVHDSWIQEVVKKGRFEIKKIQRVVNTADMLASPSTAEEVKNVMKELDFHIEE